MAAVVGDLQAAEFQQLSAIPDVRTHPLWVDTADIEGADLSAGSIRAAIARRRPVQERLRHSTETPPSGSRRAWKHGRKPTTTSTDS
jgi:hypothetical protein